MERDEFLKSLGLGLALVCTGSCFQACSKGGDDDDTPPDNGNPGSGNVSVDISTLAAVGSQRVISGVLFFRLAAGNTNDAFVATEAICPHQGGNLGWQPANNHIECDNHQARFLSSGQVKSNPSTGDSVRALKIYSTTLTGTTLTASRG